MKQIPNIFTLLNLFFGCIALTLILQNGLIATVNEEGDALLMIPERIYWASVCIAIAAIIDFLDGFLARLLNATSGMGKQLDSLADVVSFGVAPGMILYQFLRLSYAQQEDGLDISILWLLPAFIVPCAGAYRLARYNLDIKQSVGFKGVPIPAAGLLIASFPLIYWYSSQQWVVQLFLNKFFLYAVIIMVSYLMTSTLPMMAMKLQGRTVKDNVSKIILLLVAIVSAMFLQWLAVPIIFVTYVITSLALPETKHV